MYRASKLNRVHGLLHSLAAPTSAVCYRNTDTLPLFFLISFWCVCIKNPPMTRLLLTSHELSSQQSSEASLPVGFFPPLLQLTVRTTGCAISKKRVLSLWRGGGIFRETDKDACVCGRGRGGESRLEVVMATSYEKRHNP